MSENIEVYQDENCTQPFKSLGDIGFNMRKSIPIFVKNVGKTRLLNVSIKSTYPDTQIIEKSHDVLNPNEVAKFTISWYPADTSMQIFKSGKNRSGILDIYADESMEYK